MSLPIIINGRLYETQELKYKVTESGVACIDELNEELEESLLIDGGAVPLLLQVSSEMRRLFKENPKKFNRDIDSFIPSLPRDWQLPIIARIQQEEFTQISFPSPRTLSKNLVIIKDAGRFPTVSLAFEHTLRFAYYCLHQSREARTKNNGRRH